MKTFLIVTAPLFNHIDFGGLIETAQTLQNKGHRVVWLTEPGRIARYLQGLGFTVESTPTIGINWDLPPEPVGFNPEGWAVYRLKRQIDSWLRTKPVRAGVQAITALAATLQPDLIIGDPFITAPAFAAEMLSLPYAVVGLPEIPNRAKETFPGEVKMLNEGEARRQALNRRFKIEGRYLARYHDGIRPRSSHLHISFFTANWFDWQGQPVPAQNRFAGGQAAVGNGGPLPAWLADLHPAPVGVTLGRTYNHEPGFFQTVIKAVASIGAYPVVITHDDDLQGVLQTVIDPQLARIVAEVEPAHLYPKLRGIIHHGGTGTTQRAICHSLPQLVVTLVPSYETEAHRIFRAGLGDYRHLEEINLENMRGLLAKTLANPDVERNAATMQQAFSALPGSKGAAQWLIDLAG